MKHENFLPGKLKTTCSKGSFVGLFHKSLLGYKKLSFRIVKTLLLIFGAAFSGVLIVFPLWYVSTRHKDIYGISALGLLGLTAALAAGKNIRSGIRNAGGFAGYMKRRILPFLWKTSMVLTAVLGLYGIVMLFAYKYHIFGSGALLFYIFFFGMVLSIDAK